MCVQHAITVTGCRTDQLSADQTGLLSKLRRTNSETSGQLRSCLRLPRQMRLDIKGRRQELVDARNHLP